MRDTHRERGRHIGRGRSRLHVESPVRDSIPEPQDHDLNQRRTLNQQAPQVPLESVFLYLLGKYLVLLLLCHRVALFLTF